MSAALLESLVSGSLERCAGRIEQRAGGVWSFALENGKRLPASAQIREGWAELRVPLTDRLDPDLPWSLLRANGTLRGPARFVRHDDRRVGLHAEVAVDNSELASVRIAGAYRSLRAAEAARQKEGLGSEGLGSEGLGTEGLGTAEPFAPWDRLSEEFGWKVTTRDGGQMGIELDAPGLMNQAFLEERGGEPLVAIELLRGTALSIPSQRAIGRFLLGLTGRLRLARGAVRSDPEAIRLEVAVPFGPPASTQELDLALEALSLACRLSSREVRALGQEPLARAYLAHQEGL